MALVAGVDSSTQSCKLVVVDTATAQVVRQANAAHPDGTQVDPQFWWQALLDTIEQVGGLADVEAISVAGQQHGLVCLDRDGEIIRPAMLWNDTSSARQAEDLVRELGDGDRELGAQRWIEAVGSVPVASLTVSKIRWLADQEPENLAQVAAICLPHDWLTWKLRGGKDLSELVTDRSDASGTGYFDCRGSGYRRDLLTLALNGKHPNPEGIILPRVAAPFETVGRTRIAPANGLLVGPGCGDNAGAALGIGLQPGQATISLGTSGVVAAISEQPVCDPNGLITGFMDASGKWLPLACTLNASRIIDAVKTMLRVDYEQFDRLALSAEPGAGGVTLLPYFEGERTPNLPEATAEISGLTLANTTPENIARAAVEGLANLMKGALVALRNAGCPVESAQLLGGGAKSLAVQKIMPQILGCELKNAPSAEYVALGAAKQAMGLL